MKRMQLSVAISAMAFAAAGANDWKKSFDIGTYNPGEYTGMVFYGADSTVTLSKDASLGAVQINTSGGPVNVLFDFKSGGNHTLTVESGNPFVGCGNANARLLGGTWECGSQTFFGGSADYYNIGNIHVILDETTINCGKFVGNVNAYDSSTILSNGAKVVVSGSVSLMNPDSARRQNKATTNVLVAVTSGSSLNATGSLQVDGSDNAAFEDCYLDYRALVTGTGSSLSAHTVELGRKWHGTELRFADHATGTFSDRLYMGESKTAKYNRLIVESGASVTFNSSSHLGQAAGADYNSIQVLDGASLVFGPDDPWESIAIGENGSFNELLVSNATFVSRYALAGGSADASNNIVRIVGQQSVFTAKDGQKLPVLFGVGHDNQYVFDDCTVDFGDKAPTFGNGSTNNTVKLINGASVSAPHFWMAYVYGGGQPAYDNTLFVGDGSTLTGAISLSSLGNRLVVSNGTVVSSSEYAFCLGDSSSGNTLAISNNWLILQGRTPKVRRPDNAFGRVQLYYNSGIRFELPPEGYAEAPIDLQIDGDSFTIEITGVEGVQEYLSENTDLRSIEIPLTSRYAGNVKAAHLEAINATLPKGCYAYVASSGLMLHVKRASRGLTLILR